MLKVPIALWLCVDALTLMLHITRRCQVRRLQGCHTVRLSALQRLSSNMLMRRSRAKPLGGLQNLRRSIKTGHLRYQLALANDPSWSGAIDSHPFFCHSDYRGSSSDPPDTRAHSWDPLVIASFAVNLRRSRSRFKEHRRNMHSAGRFYSEAQPRWLITADMPLVGHVFCFCTPNYCITYIFPSCPCNTDIFNRSNIYTISFPLYYIQIFQIFM